MSLPKITELGLSEDQMKIFIFDTRLKLFVPKTFSHITRREYEYDGTSLHVYEKVLFIPHHLRDEKNVVVMDREGKLYEVPFELLEVIEKETPVFAV